MFHENPDNPATLNVALHRSIKGYKLNKGTW